ncbi:MAG: 5'/3'-nucleotidase SurE [Anaerolineae bacterium]|jgi:5'-nucleotidase|nr:5'/3'-nucleotidase SurE [Anaerolineae bacterium]MBT3714278.1 5'/3'-nucleotidase SurE [Anaerolineae bacterium]MBT4311626.1 5'/3'-nucleotidase SurE [Anaerolineae bacterium]MBT4457718.1 5'/3'-nucleotidase SurE [Anaerolineae bacterium]MBT6061983.1 5'/3'-nucleotidase SurE [Anaerolineae bacterium]
MLKKQILLTNDDGIQSPGLWAAAEALSEIGYVTVAAPREQSSAMGRSMPITSDGTIKEETVHVNGQDWQVYAVGGSPAQSVQHGILRILDRKPDLVVSGINYGENLALGVSVSGTVGAAMEAAAFRIPALAVSLETDKEHHLSYSNEIDFSAAAYFAALFARQLLDKEFPAQSCLMKVDVPRGATQKTPWRMARLSPNPYYRPIANKEHPWDEPHLIDYEVGADWDKEPEDTDVYVMHKRHEVAVTPLTLDFTAQVDLEEFGDFLRK